MKIKCKYNTVAYTVVQNMKPMHVLIRFQTEDQPLDPHVNIICGVPDLLLQRGG